MKIEWNRDRMRWLHWAAGQYAINNIENDPRDDKAFLLRLEEANNAWLAEEIGSEIEAIFHAFALFSSDGFQDINYDMFSGAFEPPEWGTYYNRQVRIDRYTVDFLFTMNCKGAKRYLVVECDGHAFHERTREQAAHDKRRDRNLMRAGFQVMRFTGAELFRDPVKCIEEVESVIHDLLCECMADAGMLNKGSRQK